MYTSLVSEWKDLMEVSAKMRENKMFMPMLVLKVINQLIFLLYFGIIFIPTKH